SFVADVNDAAEVRGLNCIERLQEAIPSVVPAPPQIFRLAVELVLEFRIAVTPLFLTVARHEIRPAGQHVSGEMAGDYCDAVRLLVRGEEELRGFQLFHRPFAELPVVPELLPDVFE